MIENGIKIFKGMLRVHTLALKRKIGGKLPTHHAVLTWLVEHVADVITKYLQGKDGKSGYERLMGKPCREEGLEFGERVWFKKKKRRSRGETLTGGGWKEFGLGGDGVRSRA